MSSFVYPRDVGARTYRDGPEICTCFCHVGSVVVASVPRLFQLSETTYNLNRNDISLKTNLPTTFLLLRWLQRSVEGCTNQQLQSDGGDEEEGLLPRVVLL